MTVAAFTEFHVLLSLAGIASGIVVVLAMVRGRRVPKTTALFLITTIATSVTGFFFHSVEFGPPHAVGVISLIAPAVAVAALYSFHLAGPWRGSMWPLR